MLWRNVLRLLGLADNEEIVQCSIGSISSTGDDTCESISVHNPHMRGARGVRHTDYKRPPKPHATKVEPLVEIMRPPLHGPEDLRIACRQPGGSLPLHTRTTRMSGNPRATPPRAKGDATNLAPALPPLLVRVRLVQRVLGLVVLEVALKKLPSGRPGEAIHGEAGVKTESGERSRYRRDGGFCMPRRLDARTSPLHPHG